MCDNLWNDRRLQEMQLQFEQTKRAVDEENATNRIVMQQNMIDEQSRLRQEHLVTWTPLPATAELLVWQDVLAMERMNMLTQHNHEKIQIRQELLAKMAQQPVAAVPPAVGPPTPSVPTIAPAVPSPLTTTVVTGVQSNPFWLATGPRHPMMSTPGGSALWGPRLGSASSIVNIKTTSSRKASSRLFS